MPDLALGLAAAGGAGLCALGLAGPLRPRVARIGTVALGAAEALVVLVFLAAGAPAEHLALPLGLPGAGMLLALDGLSAFFLLLMLLVGTAASAAALPVAGGAAFFPPLLGAMMLTLLAGDGFALLLGFEGMAVAAFALVLAAPAEPAARRAALRSRGMAGLGTICLIAAVGLLAVPQPGGIDLGFAAIRAHPPEGWRAGLVLVLVLIGVGSQAGLVPLHVWLPSSHASAPVPGGAALAGAMTAVAFYVLIRLSFDLAGPAQPAWWGVPLIVIGAAGAVLGGLRATLEADIRSVIGAATICHAGLIAAGLGLALAARASDLPSLAALAFGGALLQAMAHALAATLLFLVAGAVQQNAGTQHLSRLGGLIRGMPATTLAALAGFASLAALPPSAGFAGVWMLLQAAIAAPRIGGLPLQMLVAVAAMAMALGVALAGAASVRLVGVGFLGRPRTPRAAAAQEPALAERVAMLGLAGAGLLVGLFPALALALARKALLLAVNAGMAGRTGVFAIAAQAEAPGYGAPGLAVLFALALALAWAFARTRSPAGYRTAPAWDGGSGAPPVWLPFGDPATQYGEASFSQTLRATLGRTLLGARETVEAPPPADTRPAHLAVRAHDPATMLLVRPALRLHRTLVRMAARLQALSLRHALALAFAALVLLLLAVAITEPS